MFWNKHFKKRVKISLSLLIFVLSVFFYLNKDSSKFEEFNAYITKGINYVDDTLEIGVVEDSEFLSTNLENQLVTVHIIDVGQAEATLIKTKDNNILIDSGEADSAKDLAKYLTDNDVTTLDLVIATHPHSDHIGGMAQIIKNFEVLQIAMPEIPYGLIPSGNSFENFLKEIDNKGKTITTINNTTSYDFNDVNFTVLYPSSNDEIPDLNNLSTIIRMDVKEVSFLFTGDAEAWAENIVLDNNIDVDILKVGHHGSKTSTTEIFLAKTSPEIALISCGKDNSYGHPHNDIIKRLQDSNVQIYRTDLNGNIVIATDGENIEIKTQKV